MGLLDTMKSMVEAANSALKVEAQSRGFSSGAGIEAIDTRGLLPMRAGFVPDFFELFGAQDVVWMPKYDESCYERGQVFAREQLTPELLAELHGRTVFLETRFSTSFGVLGVETEGGRVQVYHVTGSTNAMSGGHRDDVESVTFARLREPAGDELTYERIVDGEGFNARMKGLTYDGAAILRDAEGLKRFHPR